MAEPSAVSSGDEAPGEDPDTPQGSPAVLSGDGFGPQASDEELLESLRDTLGVRSPASTPQPPERLEQPTHADDSTGPGNTVSGVAQSRRRARRASVSEAALAVADEILTAAESAARDRPGREAGR